MVGVAAFFLFWSFLFGFTPNGGLPAVQTSSLEEAQKVLKAIDKVEAETTRPWSGPLREAGVSESELNSYIAYRIEKDEEGIMKELRLKLFPENRIEGKIHVDLRGQKVPAFIRPEMDIYFSADLLVRNAAVKIDIKQLFLENQPVQPFLLDWIIAISAKLNKTEATSINDWYKLPYGIKDVKTEKGKAIFFY
jgi:hypothetical protein